MIKVLDLGCGKKKHIIEGAKVIGLDRFNLPGVDMVYDLEKLPLPFKDNEFDEIIAFHVLEHVSNFYPLMEELWRVLKPNGKLKVRVPHGSGRLASNPDHKTSFNIHGFKELRSEYSKNYYTKAKFSLVKRQIMFIFEGSKWDFLNKIFNPILNLHQGFFEKFFPYLIDEIYFELKVKK